MTHPTTPHRNDLTQIPGAACRRCGGWTGHGGMSQHAGATAPVMGRIGCVCLSGRPMAVTLNCFPGPRER